MRVVGHEPCFEVADVERAVGHYQLLGFTISYHDENYAFAHRDNLTIHLAHSEEPTTGPGALYIHVEDADRLAEGCVAELKRPRKKTPAGRSA